MTRSILTIVLILFSLSACQTRRPVMQPTPSHGAHTPQVTKKDILDSGGSCIGNLCTDTAGREWDCSGGGNCTRNVDK